MQIEAGQFGRIEYDEKSVVRMPSGLIGMEYLNRFLVLAFEEYQPLKFMLSLENPAFLFNLVNPHLVVADYRLNLGEEDRHELGLREEGGVLVYAILTLSEDPRRATVNLLSPIVLNLETMRAKQVVLIGSDYSEAHPLVLDANAP